MEVVKLYPSDIRFSQNNISNKFSAAIGHKLIGEVVDEIYYGNNTQFDKILGNMQVGRWLRPGYEQLWFTVNNRSLWVLKQLQTIGKLNNPITVKIDANGIDKKRFTTKNDGVCVEVRARPVGGSMSQPAPFWKYKQVAVQAPLILGGGYLSGAGGAVAAVGGLGAFGGIGAFGTQYDDGYDSDEYYV